MGWFKSRQRRKHPSSGKIEEGSHRSPGLEVICKFLETEPAYTVLDLGPSSTENLEFLSELCEDLVVQDVFHSAEKKQGIRSEIFQFERARDASLPDFPQPFDVVLLWDLLHYFPVEERTELMSRLARRCAPNAMVLIMASAVADIPPEPIQFKIKRRDRLEYCLGEDRAPCPGLSTREVEKVMVGFRPVRIFQLRNGLQEMVFQLDEPPTPDVEEPATVSEALAPADESVAAVEPAAEVSRADRPEFPAEEAIEEPGVEEPTSRDSATEARPPEEEPEAEAVPAGEPPAQDPPFEEPPVGDPPFEEPPTEEPPIGEPADEEPPVEEPSRPRADSPDDASAKDEEAEPPGGNPGKKRRSRRRSRKGRRR